MAFVPVAAAVLGTVGTGLSALGTYEGGQATANAATYSAQVAANNALIAKQNAKYAIEAGEAQATATALKGANTAGRIKAAQAASGVSVNSGSASDVQVSQREGQLLDTETILNNAELQAYGYRTAATGYRAEAELEQAKAQQAPIGADLGAAGSLLSGASGVAAKWGAGALSAAPAGYDPNTTSSLY
jgi:hypothetical protein